MSEAELAGWRAVFEHAAAPCREAGFDLLHPFNLSWFVDDERLAAFDRPRALGMIVGNSRALWPLFVASERARREHREPGPHPLDEHCEQALLRAAQESGVRTSIHLGHDLARRLPIQRLAHAVGMAHLSPSHLCIHPDHGPWIALRAALVFDIDGPDESALPAPDPCSTCPRPCLEALRDAQADGRPLDASWRLWVAVRDACPEGRASRYDDDAIRYHYTKNPEVLRAATASRSPSPTLPPSGGGSKRASG
jgi:methylmalonic aciduria homocystinuria type C protein